MPGCHAGARRAGRFGQAHGVRHGDLLGFIGHDVLAQHTIGLAAAEHTSQVGL